MMRPRPPLLRAPPFPWIKPATVAVSRAGQDGLAPDDDLIAAIRAARVGGTFWAPPLPQRPAPGTTIVRSRHPVGIEGPILLVDRDAEVDPWSALGPDVSLVADEDDEWRLIAAIAGARVLGQPPSAGEIGEALSGAWRNPFTDQPATTRETVTLLAFWRDRLDANRAIGACAGMAWWKKDRMAEFLWTGRDTPLVFAGPKESGVAAAQASGGALAVWPSRVTPNLLAEAEAATVPVVRVEDGFVRSVGLGADLLPPFSIVADRGGIYYDPGPPSDLEHLLETAEISPELQARGRRLATTMVERGISKYGSAAPPPREVPRGGRTILVAGQVEDDLSVRKAGGDVAGNLDLLRRVRAIETDATILFKPHPDVDAGHRVGRVADEDALAFANEVVRAEPTQSLLARVDAVHVLTSLVGFEALLRGVETHVHGSPFFACWGLTHDHGLPLPRRTRTRTLDELVAATLILYPLYLDPVTRLPCPPEILLERFANGWKPGPSAIVWARRWQGRLFKLLGRATS